MDLNKPRLLNDARIADTRLDLDPHLWNWHAGVGDGDGGAPPAHYYEASLADWTQFAPLGRDEHCDVLVVGGGLLGASTALHLAQAGVDVILVEKDSVGSAASGRNGGQLTPGLARWEATDMLAHLGPDEARRLWRFASTEAMDLVDELAARHGFDLDRRHGHITAAIHPGHLASLVEGADARLHLGDDQVDVVGARELHDHICSDIYHGATIDHLGGQLHPLALLRGLVHAFAKLGGRVYEGSKVLDIGQTAQGACARTEGGSITARKGLVLAVHHTTFEVLADAPATTLPFYTYVGVTPPLETDMSELLPSDMAVYDTQLQIDYYRGVRHNRLLFGGQGTGSSWSPERINDYLLERIRTVFPQIDTPSLEYSWSGISDLTLNGATDCRKLEEDTPIYLVQGWSGHGVAQTVRIGKAISDDIGARNDDFAMLTAIGHREIPLGRQLSAFAIPVVKAAMGMMSAVNPGRMLSF